MITIQELISDEEEAIRKYQDFLNQGFTASTKNQIPIIKRIQEDERDHLRKLRRMKWEKRKVTNE